MDTTLPMYNRFLYVFYLNNGCYTYTVHVLKTLYLRRQSRLESGKKTTAVDERYFYLAEEQLYGELSFVLGKTKDEIIKEICWE